AAAGAGRAAACLRGGAHLRPAQSGRPARDARIARLDELHDLRLLQLAALLPRPIGTESRVVDGVISALVGLSLIVGNACVAPLSRVVRTRTGLLMLSAGAQAVLAVACGLLTNFFAVVSLYRS